VRPLGRYSKNSARNMAYLVEITDRALLDAEEYVEFIRHVKREPEAARRWFRGFVAAVYSLEELPDRCPR